MCSVIGGLFGGVVTDLKPLRKSLKSIAAVSLASAGFLFGLFALFVANSQDSASGSGNTTTASPSAAGDGYGYGGHDSFGPVHSSGGGDGVGATSGQHSAWFDAATYKAVRAPGQRARSRVWWYRSSPAAAVAAARVCACRVRGQGGAQEEGWGGVA